MNVCVINPDFYRSSGVTNVIKTLDYGLRKYPNLDLYYVHCNFLNSKSQDLDWIPSDRLFNFNLMTLNPINLFKEMIRFNRWSKQKKFSIIHTHHRRLAIITRFLPTLFRAKHIYTTHLVYQFSLLFWIFSPQYSCAISQSTLDNLKRTTRCKNNIFTGNPYIFQDEKNIIDLSRNCNSLLATAVGRLDPVKGHEYLIDAWKILIDHGINVHLNIIGEGELKTSLIQKAKMLGISNYIHFLGYQNNPTEWISKSKFNILVSSNEGLPLTILDAANCGKPTLVTNVPGSRDCIPPNSSLINKIPFGNIEKLVSALEAWFKTDEIVMQSEGVIYYRFLKEIFDLDNVISKYIKIYEDR